MEKPRVWKGVYCDEAYVEQVNAALLGLLEQLTKEHPEYRFDVDGPDWEDDWDGSDVDEYEP